MPLTPAWLATALGLAITGAFSWLAARDMRRATLVFLVMGWVPFVRVFTFHGSQIQQPLLLAEALPTVMIAIWWLRRARGPAPPLVPAPVNRPLLLMVPASALALLWSFGDLDPAVPAANVKLAVSLGQILLIAWPVGLYFVVANTAWDAAAIRRVRTALTIMAAPSVALPLVPAEWRSHITWSAYFALAAGPWLVTGAFEERTLARRLGLWIVALSPLLYGLVIGKAFLYLTTLVAVAVVVFIRARKTVGVGVLGAAGVYLLLVAATGSLTPGPLRDLLDVERRQQSWGGQAGRLALASDAVEIWSRHPLLGVGPGNSWPYMHRYSTLDTPHNQYVNVLLEFGAVGLACFVWFLAAALKTGRDALRRARDGPARNLVIGWLALFIGMIASGLTGDYIFHSVRNGGLLLFSAYYFQWVLLGLVVAASAGGGDGA